MGSLPNYPSGPADVKILGPKNSNIELSVSQYQNMKAINQFDQYLNGSSLNDHNPSQLNLCNLYNDRKEVKILGKRLETGLISTNENGMIKIVDKKFKTVSFALIIN